VKKWRILTSNVNFELRISFCDSEDYGHMNPGITAHHRALMKELTAVYKGERN
jgi:hypothetical protein